MKKQIKIQPRQPSGVKDYLPSEMIPRLKIIDTVRRIFERFGFDPLDTPALELRDVLTGGRDDFSMIIYSAKLWGRGVQEKVGDDGSDLALRYDLTVPLARVIASNPQLVKPFKRYQIGNVWRGERPQRGRYREFMQFDADIVGSSSIQADVEILALIFETLTALNVGKFTISVNNRKVLNGLPALIGYPEHLNRKVLQVLDKLDKIGREGVACELQAQASQDTDSPELSTEQAQTLFSFIDLGLEGGNAEKLAQARKLFAEVPPALEGLRELEDIFSSLTALKIPEEYCMVNFSVARGLGYYTGPVFETTLDALPKIGSVFSGGRYDGLVEQFSAESVPATGASIGVDRLFAALKEMGQIEGQATNTEVMIINSGAEFAYQYQMMATELRHAGIKTSIYLDDKTSFGEQLKRSEKLGVLYAVVYGPKDAESQTVRIKNLHTREEVAVPHGQAVVWLSGMLS